MAYQAPTKVCTLDEIVKGLCPGDGTAVTVGDTKTDGDSGSGGEDGSTGSGGAGDSGGGGATEPSPWDICAATPGPPSAFCRSLAPIGVPIGQPDPATPGWSVTISDLVRFVPTNATLSAEPQNVAVVGLPANFVSTAKTETIPGTILGRALTIRFTPVSHHFDYGDGTQLDSATPGAAWDATGQAQFTPTGTSHVYKEPGTYTASVITTYTAEIDLGTGWIPVSGTLTGPSATQQIRVVKARTALVHNTCTERPSAPGC